MAGLVSDSRYRHVANGSATTSLIARAGIPGETSIWADPLHDGPVPGGLGADELRSVRAHYISATFNDGRWHDVHADLLSWDRALLGSSACDELVLWFEHDLFDQLNLIHLLDRLASIKDRPATISLICIGEFPGRPLFKGLGELMPGDLASLFATRQTVGEAQFAAARQAWHAFRSSTPVAIETLLDENLDALPFLAPALRRHLEEFPSTTDGLSRTERRLLQLASGEATDVGQVFSQMHSGETAFYVADASFLNLVRQLAGLTPALLSRDDAIIQTTADGLALLNGRADRISLCGIDKWLGGVHLRGSGPVWRWDPATGRPTFA